MHGKLQVAIFRKKLSQKRAGVFPRKHFGLTAEVYVQRKYKDQHCPVNQVTTTSTLELENDGDKSFAALARNEILLSCLRRTDRGIRVKSTIISSDGIRYCYNRPGHESRYEVAERF